MNGKLTEYPGPASANVRSVRLVDQNGPQLVAFDTPRLGAAGFFEAPVAGGAPAWRRVENVSPRAQAGWDVAAAGGGSLRFVFSNPESATKWLSLVNSNSDASTMVTSDYDRGYFGAPRFVKREPGASIASIAAVEGTARPVVFVPRDDGEYGAYRLLPDLAQGSAAEALLIRTQEGYLAVVRVLSGSGARNPGVLYCASLDAGFRVTRAGQSCLETQTVFDFDADAAAGRMVIFASTPKGYLVATGSLGSLDVIEHESAAVTSTSVLLSGNTAHLTALSGGKILTGSAALKASGE